MSKITTFETVLKSRGKIPREIYSKVPWNLCLWGTSVTTDNWSGKEVCCIIEGMNERKNIFLKKRIMWGEVRGSFKKILLKHYG